MDVLTGLSEEFTNSSIDCNVRDPIKTQAMRVNKRKKRGCFFFSPVPNVFPTSSQEILRKFPMCSPKCSQSAQRMR
jgi:hypothetical protein